MSETSNPAPAARAADGRAWWAIPVVAVLASYASTFTAGFVWDDHELIVRSPLILGKTGIGAHFFQSFWNNALLFGRSFYRPLVTLSYAADHALWGNFAGGFHLTNVVFHLVATMFLVLLCRRAGAGHKVACLLATVFAVFPRLTESVAWISGRTDILAAVGAFGALWLFQPGPGKAWSRVGASLMLLAGLLCKEVAIAAAVAMGVSSSVAAKGGARLRRLVLDLLPVGAALAIYGILRWNAMGSSAVDPPEGFRTVKSVFLAFGEAQARYAWMVVDALRPRLQLGDRYHPNWLVSLVGVGILAMGIYGVARARARISPSGWSAIALGGTALFLVSHVIHLDVNIIAADRFLYVPLAALMMGLAGLVERAFQRHRRIMLPILFGLIGVFALATSLRARLWGNEIGLWRSEVKDSPDYIVLPRIELAVALLHRGRYAESLPLLESVPPEYQYLTVLNRATCMDKLGRRREAVALLETTLASETRPSLRYREMINLALLYARARDFSRARAMGAAIAARLADRPDILELVGKVATAEAEWSALPPETADEPLATKAARATWFAKLGALPDAQARFLEIVKDPRASAELVTQAVGFLVFEGPRDVAQEGLDIVAKRGLLARELPALGEALRDRFDDGE